MTRSFRLPDLGEGVHEGEVLAVHVTAGQPVKEGDVILEVETDKAAVEIPSPFSGTVAEVLVHPGDLVSVGTVLVTFDNGAPQAAAEPPTRPRPAEAAAASQDKAAPKEAAPPSANRRTPVPASPATRRLARELGVDLRQVTPSGSGGVVTADDVRAFDRSKQSTPEPPGDAATEPVAPGPVFPAAPALPDFEKWGAVERVALRSIRRATAAQMAIAWSQIPHVASQDTLDVSRLEAFRRKHKAGIEAAGGRLTLTIFVLKALATALKTYPQFNASLDINRQEIILKQYFHIGVAVNTDRGLIVPVIRDVDRKSIKELSIELHDCVQQTRAGKISRESLQGGSMTITNAGAMGGGFFTPIINFPEVAILGMGQARMQPVVITEDEGLQRIVPRLMMPMVLCFDHRVADGADAIGFLRVMIDALEDPDELLISMI
jgi:pyruvate dehydrogenase E2 component (dihydrolipoamide acetyltransferase)